MARAVMSTLPVTPSAPAPVQRPRRRLRLERVLLSLCFAYLLAFMGWGEVTNLRLQAQERRLATELRLENQRNAALRQSIRSLHQNSGLTSAIQSQLGLAPKGEIPVIVKGNN